jgi:hypothetical protein
VIFDKLSISQYTLFYEETRVFHTLQPYLAGLQTLFASELQQKWKKPVYKLHFSHSGFGTKFYGMGSHTLFTAIKNYIMGSTEETPMRIIKAEDYEFDKAKDTLVSGGTTYIIRYSEFDDMSPSMLATCQGLFGTEFYVMYQPKPPMMWEEYKAALVERGLPQSYADRISQTQRDQLVNFGRVLTPYIDYQDQKWTFKWMGCAPDRCKLGLLEIELEPIELGLPARKKRRGGLPLTQYQRALVEISPSFFCCRCDIVDCSEKNKSVRAPKYVTRKCGPFKRWADNTLLWTGKAKYYRTWFYEIMSTVNGTIMYIPEGKMHQKSYANRRLIYAANNKVMPARQPTCLKTIFIAGI